jgi:hypothetical protein
MELRRRAAIAVETPGDGRPLGDQNTDYELTESAVHQISSPPIDPLPEDGPIGLGQRRGALV